MPKDLSIRPTNNSGASTPAITDRFFEDLQKIHDDIARSAFGLFEKRENGDGSALDDWLRAEAALLKPVPLSIRDETDHLTVTADVPGFSLDQLKVHVDGRTLQICGKVDSSEKTENGESSTGRRIRCELSLPAGVRAEAPSVTLAKGVLTLVLPKVEAGQEIPVKAAA